MCWSFLAVFLYACMRVCARLTFCILCTAQERRWRQCQRALGCSHVRSIVVVVAAAVRVYNNQLVRCAGFSTIRWLQYVLIKANSTGIAVDAHVSLWMWTKVSKAETEESFALPFYYKKAHRITKSFIQNGMAWHGMACVYQCVKRKPNRFSVAYLHPFVVL